MTGAIRILSQTAETVAVSRVDFETLIEAAEDAEDLAAIDAFDAEEARIGKEAAKRNYLSSDACRRLLDGESPVSVWRDKRGMTLAELARAAGVMLEELVNIEARQNVECVNTIGRLAAALGGPRKIWSAFPRGAAEVLAGIGDAPVSGLESRSP